MGSAEVFDDILRIVGGTGLESRLIPVARYCAERFLGDLVEIGCQFGDTTVKLAGIARVYDKRVVAVDPWEKGTQNCRTGREYDEFLRKTHRFEDIVDVVRLSSFSPGAVEYVRGRDLCFAYVDGLHTYDACLSDIQATAHCAGVIAVDDVNIARVRRAFLDGAVATGRVPLFGASPKMGYLVAR